MLKEGDKIWVQAFGRHGKIVKVHHENEYGTLMTVQVDVFLPKRKNTPLDKPLNPEPAGACS